VTRPSDPSAPPQGSRGQWLSDRLLRGLIGAALALPYSWRIPATGWLFARLLGPLAGYRRRAETQLAAIWPDRSAAWRRQTATRCLDNFGRTLIEIYSGPDLTARMADTPITGPGHDAVTAARAAGRPVVFVTGHFGNHEAPRHALVARGFQIGGLYRPMRNPYFDAHYSRTMTQVSGPVFAQGRPGTMGFVRHLRQGGMATLLFDVWARDGAMIPFLGQPAPTALSAADLALRFDALLVPYFGIRQPDGLSFEIVIEDPIAPSDPETMMHEATRRLEARIVDHPEQWFWVHRRWKPGKV